MAPGTFLFPVLRLKNKPKASLKLFLDKKATAPEGGASTLMENESECRRFRDFC
jgi:hypothetical protein